MTYLKIWMVFLLLTFVIWWAFYTWVITKVRFLVSESNSWFIALLPVEGLAIIWIIMFVILMGLAYAIFRE